MEQLNQQWSTIMDMNFYDLENCLKSYNRILEERKKAEEEEAKKEGFDDSKYSPEALMSQAQRSLKVPSVNIPKF